MIELHPHNMQAAGKELTTDAPQGGWDRAQPVQHDLYIGWSPAVYQTHTNGSPQISLTVQFEHRLRGLKPPSTTLPAHAPGRVLCYFV